MALPDESRWRRISTSSDGPPCGWRPPQGSSSGFHGPLMRCIESSFGVMLTLPEVAVTCPACNRRRGQGAPRCPTCAEALHTAGLSCQTRLGHWEVRGEFIITNRVVVTPDGAMLYLVQALRSDGDSAVYAGRLHSCQTRRWILELSPVPEAPQDRPARFSRSSSARPSYPLLAAIRTHLGLESERTRACALDCAIACRCSWRWSAEDVRQCC